VIQDQKNLEGHVIKMGARWTTGADPQLLATHSTSAAIRLSSRSPRLPFHSHTPNCSAQHVDSVT